MNMMENIAKTWKSVELRIAFHKDKFNRPRETPHLWSPKNALANLLDGVLSKAK